MVLVVQLFPVMLRKGIRFYRGIVVCLCVCVWFTNRIKVLYLFAQSLSNKVVRNTFVMLVSAKRARLVLLYSGSR